MVVLIMKMVEQMQRAGRKFSFFITIVFRLGASFILVWFIPITSSSFIVDVDIHVCFYCLFIGIISFLSSLWPLDKFFLVSDKMAPARKGTMTMNSKIVKGSPLIFTVNSPCQTTNSIQFGFWFISTQINILIEDSHRQIPLPLNKAAYLISLEKAYYITTAKLNIY